MKKKLSEELGRLCALCHEISSTTEHDVFMQYLPHVNAVSVNVNEGGWGKGGKSLYITKIGGDQITFKNINQVKAKLQKYKKAPTGAATPDVGTDLKNQLQSTPNLGDCQGGN